MLICCISVPGIRRGWVGGRHWVPILWSWKWWGEWEGRMWRVKHQSHVTYILEPVNYHMEPANFYLLTYQMSPYSFDWYLTPVNFCIYCHWEHKFLDDWLVRLEMNEQGCYQQQGQATRDRKPSRTRLDWVDYCRAVVPLSRGPDLV